MPSIDEVKEWRGRNAVGTGGDKLGSIEDIYLDEDTGQPEWLALKTGMLGGNLSFAPLAEARQDGDNISVPYSQDQVKDAPNVDADGVLSQEEEAKLYQHYGLDYGENRSDSGLAEGRDTGRETVGRDTSGPKTDDAMTRSEEELRVGKTKREVGKAKLRKYIVTENVTKTVPVEREEVRIEREPITDANRGDALDGPDLTEEEHEVTLHAEEVVVDKNVVAKERVRLDKDTVTENREVSDEVRKEVIDADTGVDTDLDRDKR